MNRSLTLIATGLPPLVALSANVTQFDTETLKAQGIPVSVADYFRESARFPSGNVEVTLMVNGHKHGQTNATFNPQGQLCADKNLLRKINVTAPALLLADNNDKPQGQASCAPLEQLLPGSTVTLQPGHNIVALLVPLQMLANDTPLTQYTHGGVAALLNYNLFNVRSRTAYGSSSNYYADLEAGLNAGNWLLRNKGTYSSQDGSGHYQHQSAYVQHTFTGLKSTFQAGQLNLYGSLFSVPSFTGIQWFPDDALVVTQRDTVVSGIAPSPARIEVRQAGVLIYSTLVPAGPFVLSQLPLMSQSIDLDVEVIENNGGRNAFSVGASSFSSNFSPTQTGIAFALGQTRTFGANDGNRSFVTATRSWPLASNNLTSGVLLAQHYLSTGITLNVSPTKNSRGYLRGVWAKSPLGKVSGLRTELGYSLPLSKTLFANASAGYQTPGFRGLSDSLVNSKPVGVRLQYNLSLSYSHNYLGGFSFGLSHNENFFGQTSTSPVLAWSRSFGQANVSLSAESNGGEPRYYLNTSIPLGKTSVSLYAQKNRNQTQYGVSADQQLNEYLDYNIAASTSASQERQNAYSGNLRLHPNFAQMSLGYSGNNNHSNSLSASMRGSMVHDGKGFLFSSTTVQDTFSIVSAPGLAGVKVQTPSGAVWTNTNGRALVPSIPAYTESQVMLVPKGLPRNVEIHNGINKLESARGTVSHVAFDVSLKRNLLLQITPDNGQTFASGTGVTDAQGNYLSVVGSDNDVFLDAELASKGLQLDLGNGKRCYLKFQLDEKPADTDAPYETIPAICREGAQ